MKHFGSGAVFRVFLMEFGVNIGTRNERCDSAGGERFIKVPHRTEDPSLQC